MLQNGKKIEILSGYVLDNVKMDYFFKFEHLECNIGPWTNHTVIFEFVHNSNF